MTDGPCTFLRWDSDFFGRRIARADKTRLGRRDMDEVLTWCEAERIACLYLLVEADDPESVRAAEEAGFHLVDVRVTMEWSGTHECGRLGAVVVRSSRPGDLPALQKIAGTIHTASRFYFDRRLSAKAPELFRTWIAKSVESPSETVLVAESGGGVAGYVTCEARGGHGGTIGLLGVEPSFAGEGVGQALVGSGLEWFVENDVRTVDVVTQGRNVPAQRLYQRCGFLTREVQLWYHKWFSGE